MTTQQIREASAKRWAEIEPNRAALEIQAEIAAQLAELVKLKAREDPLIRWEAIKKQVNALSDKDGKGLALYVMGYLWRQTDAGDAFEAGLK